MTEEKKGAFERFTSWVDEKVTGKKLPEYTQYDTAGGAVKYVTDRKLEERMQEALAIDKLLYGEIKAETLRDFLKEVLSRLELLNMKVERVAKAYIRAASVNPHTTIDGKMLLHGWGQLYQSSYARGKRKLENYGTDEKLNSHSIQAIHVINYYRGLQNVLFKKAHHVFSASFGDIDVTARGVQVQIIPSQNNQVDMSKAFAED